MTYTQILLLWGLLATAPFPVLAQEKKAKTDPAGTVYKQMASDGSVIYTDTPNRSMKVEKTIAPDAGSSIGPFISSAPRPPMRATQGVAGPIGQIMPGAVIPNMPPLPGDSALRPPGPNQPSSQTVPSAIDTVDAELGRAEDDLSAAMKAAGEGAVPLPGERSGTATGGSRLNDSYQKRQDELSESVKRQRKKVDDLLEKRRRM